MYTNIPIREFTDIIKNILDNKNTTEKNKELKTLLNTIINQNYSQFNQYYKKEDGLEMGAPTSAVLVEIFIQHVKHTSINNILNKFTQSIISHTSTTLPLSRTP
jgi:hypothetical protein